MTCVGTYQKISITVGMGHLKATQWNKLHEQEISMRIDLEANQDPSGIYFKMRLRELWSSRRISQENQGFQDETVK